MNYLRQALDLILPAIILSLAVYLPLYVGLLRKKRWPFLRLLAAYALVGYGVMLVIVTFLLLPRFGEISYSINLIPFRAFHDAYVYGSTHVLQQYMLNIVMFIPLGFLLPVIFPHKMTRWLPVIITILSATVAIELTQFFMGRVVDVDDIITNFMGGMGGFSLYILLERVLKQTQLWQTVCTGAKLSNRKNIVLATILLIIPWVAPLTATVIDATAEFGRTPDLHFRLPEDAVIEFALSDSSLEGTVFKTIVPNPVEQIMSSILGTLGLTGQANWTPDKWQYRYHGQDVSVFVHENGTWRVSYHHSLKGQQDAVNSDDESCIELGKVALESMGVDISNLSPIDVVTDWGYFQQSSGSEEQFLIGKHVVFEDKTLQEGLVVTGTVAVYLGDNDVLLHVADNRQYHQLLRAVATISQVEAIERMKNSGMRTEALSQVVVTAVEADVILESRKGHLHPAWRISGTFLNKNGQTDPWSALIDARR